MTPTSRPRQLRFAEFRLDLANEMLTAHDDPRPLTPKAFNVLLFLIENGGILVTKQMLLEAIWPDTIVGDAVLKVIVREIRKKLGDNSRDPRFIQTVHRRGYRFIHAVEETSNAPKPPKTSERLRPPPTPFPRNPMATLTSEARPEQLVGRSEVLQNLRESFFLSLPAKSPAFVFLTGNTGMGKSAALNYFLGSVSANWKYCLLMRANCVEHSGEAEGLTPILEAIGNTCYQAEDSTWRDLLARYAPSCLVRLASLSEEHDREQLRLDAMGNSATRLLRETADWIEACSRRRPVVLTIEDIHWADPLTIDLLSLLAKRRSAALFVVATWRPEDLSPDVQRRLREFVATGQARELALPLLTVGQIATYLSQRFKSSKADSGDLARFVHAKTEGQPLFAVNLVDELQQGGHISPLNIKIASSSLDALSEFVPANVEQMIHARLQTISPQHRHLLEAASVAAVGDSKFSTLSVAAALGETAGDLEDVFEEIWRTGRFIFQGETLLFADGIISQSYTFTHSLYRQVLYSTMTKSRRLRYHLRIISSGKELFSDRRDEIAHEIARHYEYGGDLERACSAWQHAGVVAATESRAIDAERFFSRSLQCGKTATLEFRLSLFESRGLARRSLGKTKSAEQDFLEMAELARQVNDRSREVEALLYLSNVRFWIDTNLALQTASDAVKLASRDQPSLLLAHGLGYWSHLRLNLLEFDPVLARDCDLAVKACRQSQDEVRLGFHLTRKIWLDCLRSNYSDAATAAVEAAALNRKLGNTFDYMLTLFWWSWATLHRGNWGEALEKINDGLQMADRNAHAHWVCLFGVLRAQVLVEIGMSEEALELCAAASALSRSAAQTKGQLGWHASIVGAQACLALNAPEKAWNQICELDKELLQPSAQLDTILRLPQEEIRARTLLALGRDAEAAEAATSLRSFAETCGEHSYAARASLCLASVALEQEQIEIAKAELAAAALSLKDGDSAWFTDLQIQHCRKKLSEKTEKPAASTASNSNSDEAFEILARSLDAWPHFQDTWLQSPFKAGE
ncbi:MAG: AAA family ATPase [Planctomycetota bacterium]